MSLSSQPFDGFRDSHHHLDGDLCPMCDQLIPNDRVEQVRARQQQHQRELESQYALKLKAELGQVTAQLQQQNAESLAKAKDEAAAREIAAREEERKAANAQADLKITAAQSALETARNQAAELQHKLEASDAAAAEKVTVARLEERRTASAEAATKIAAAIAVADGVRAEAMELKRQLDSAAAATAEQIAAASQAARNEAEAALQPQLVAARAIAQQAQEQAQTLSEREQNAQARIAQLNQDVVAARDEGKRLAETDLRAQLAAMAEEKQSAVTAKTSAEARVRALQENQDKAVREAITETREALEKSHRDALNATNAKHFEDTQKVQSRLEELQRQLDNKTAQELGEGAEVDLFEALKAAFPDDDITRIKRGVAGADIRHMVRLNGRECGLILYDSKNHKAWRNDFVTKLRDDQIADEADHAILSTIAFPQGARQLHVADGVILVNPARAVVIAQVVRRHILNTHSLTLSNDDREQKSLELYSFIMSERFGALMTKLRATTDSLAELDVKEQAAHKAVWQKRGQLITGVAKAEADIQSEIDRIIGTASVSNVGILDDLPADTAGAGI